ncbi:XRE family transcriptional regulator, partial [Mycolicibacterium fortuitum subsp. acetamidolyticum]
GQHLYATTRKPLPNNTTRHHTEPTPITTQNPGEYQLLSSLRGEHKRLECLHVTLTEKSQTYPLFQHPGTEFLYMLEGVMDYSHSRSVYRLQPGDSLQIDGEGAHGPVDLIELPIRFLSVIAFPDSQV